MFEYDALRLAALFFDFSSLFAALFDRAHDIANIGAADGRFGLSVNIEELCMGSRIVVSCCGCSSRRKRTCSNHSLSQAGGRVGFMMVLRIVNHTKPNAGDVYSKRAVTACDELNEEKDTGSDQM